MRRLLFILLLGSFSSYAQVQDAEAWGGLGLKIPVGKDLLIKYETQTRFNKNASALKTYYNELTVRYDLAKGLDVGVNYRYSRKNRESHFIGDHRLALNLAYGLKIGDTGLRIKNRVRYQYVFDRFSVINDAIYPDMDHTFRWKMDFKYKIKDVKRIIPFAGYEYFKALQPAGLGGFADAYRIYGGIDFDLPARHELSAKYIYERENGTIPGIAHIYLLQYNYQLSSKLFKKKKKD